MPEIFAHPSLAPSPQVFSEVRWGTVLQTNLWWETGQIGKNNLWLWPYVVKVSIFVRRYFHNIIFFKTCYCICINHTQLYCKRCFLAYFYFHIYTFTRKIYEIKFLGKNSTYLCRSLNIKKQKKTKQKKQKTKKPRRWMVFVCQVLFIAYYVSESKTTPWIKESILSFRHNFGGNTTR